MLTVNDSAIGDSQSNRLFFSALNLLLAGISHFERPRPLRCNINLMVFFFVPGQSKTDCMNYPYAFDVFDGFRA